MTTINNDCTSSFILLNHMIINDFSVIASLVSYYLRSKTARTDRRSPPLQTQRLNWSIHRDKLIRKGLFDRTYRMKHDAFTKLVDYLRSALDRNKQMASVRSGINGLIIPEIRMHCLIRFFAGGSYLDICSLTGIDTSYFYKIVWETSEALNNCRQLDLSGIPTNMEEADPIAYGFEEISTFGVLDKCVGVVDGYFCSTITPSKIEGNIKSFYSGHYRHMGLNIQAVADSDCQFLYFAVAAPGSTNDVEAITRLTLYDYIEDLPNGYYIIGDSAYNATEHLLPIFCGQDRLDVKNDAWNYYASSLRIRIEMAFGIMNMKWQILKRPLAIRFHNIPKALNSISRLHNYIIQSKNPSDQAERAEVYNAIVSTIRNNSADTTTTATAVTPIASRTGTRGSSALRKMLVEKVYAMGLERPTKKARKM